MSLLFLACNCSVDICFCNLCLYWIVLIDVSFYWICLYAWLYVLLGTDHFTWRGGYGFLFRSDFFFRTTQELEYLFFFQTLTLDYMTKTLNQILFFLHQNQNIFFSNIGHQNIFLDKTIIPSPPFKLNGRSLKYFGFKLSWWGLVQKRVLRTKFNICILILFFFNLDNFIGMLIVIMFKHLVSELYQR